MKTITVSAGSLTSGGAERVASLVSNYLDNKGYKVHFIATYSSEREYKLNDSIEYKFVGNCNWLGKIAVVPRMIKIYRYLRKTNTDVYISFIAVENFLLCKSKKFKKIFSLRNDPNSSIILNTYSRRWITLHGFRNADCIVFQTEDARNYFEEKIRAKGRIIYNPISPNLPYWKDYEHEKTIVTACRLEPQKNLKMMIDAFALFVAKHPEYKLKIFGVGMLRDSLATYIEKKGLNDCVALCGRSDKIFDEYVRSEIFALSSDFEGISNSMLEALAIGIPVVCTDCPCGGARTFIESYTNGILTKVGDTEEFANALCRMADDEKLREKVSNNSVKIREILDVETICSKWQELVEEES